MQQDLQSLRRALAEACRERDEMQCALNASRSEFQQLHQRMLAVQSHLQLLKTRLDSLESSRPDWRRVKSFNSQKSKEYLDKLSSAPAPTAAPAAAPAAPAHPAAIGRRKERAAAPAAAPAAPAHPAAIGGKQPAGIHNGAAGPSNGKRPLEPAAGPSAKRPRLAAGVAARAAAGPSSANASPTAAPAAAEASIAALSPPPRALGPEDCGGCHLPVIWDQAQSSSDGRHKCNSCGHLVHAASYVCIAAGAKHTNLIASEGTFYCSVTCQLLESAYYAQ